MELMACGNPLGSGVFAHNLRFPGQYFDKETGLAYNYFRDYDPQTGRYVQSDPIGLAGGLSPYLYVFADPLRLSDSLGLEVDRKTFPKVLPEGWGARVDSFNFGGQSSFEIHVCDANGREVGFFGEQGWFDKHGKHGAPAGLPKGVESSVKGIAIDELRKRGKIPPKGLASIKGNNWLKSLAGKCKGMCGPGASILIIGGGLMAGDTPGQIAGDAVCEAMWGCGEAQ